MIAGIPSDVMSTDKFITYHEIGNLNGDVLNVIILDEDMNYATDEDSEMYIGVNGSLPARYTNNSTAESSPCFANIDGTDYMFWYENGNISYITDVAGPVYNVFEYDEALAADAISIIQGGGDTKLVWKEVREDETGNPISYAFASNCVSGEWSEPYLMMELDSDVSDISGYINEGNAYIGFSAMHENSTDLLVRLKAPVTDIDTKYIEHIQEIPGEELNIDVMVENTGMTVVSSINAVITRNGADIHTVVIPVNIPIGNAINISVPGFTVPVDITMSDELLITVTTNNETDLDDNQLSFKLGHPDLKVSLEREFDTGNQTANITVTNTSAFATTAILKVRCDSLSGPIIEEYSLGEITSGVNTYISFDLNKIHFETGSELIYFEIVGETDDYNYSDNSDYTYLSLGLDGTADLAPMEVSISTIKCTSAEVTDGAIFIEAIRGSGYYEYSIDGGLTWLETGDFYSLASGI